MASPEFNDGDAVRVVGGPFDGRRGTVTTAEAATQSPQAFVPRGIDANTAVWVALDLYGQTNAIVLLPTDELRQA